MPSLQSAMLAALAIAPSLLLWVVTTLAGRGHSFNDFHDFYLAAKLVTEGRSPYDLDALRAIAAREGLSFVVGTGYSYPLPFALAMIPLTALPFTPAALLFNAIGLVVFGLVVAVWLRRWHRGFVSQRRLAGLALLAGAYPPVYGTIASGQANLIVFGLLCIGTIGVLDAGGRAIPAGAAVGLAAAVKLVPAIIAVPLTLAGRVRSVLGVGVGLGGSLALAAIAAPWAASGSSRLVDLLSPDPYFTNQSINGFVSRLVLGSDRTSALAPNAFDPFPVASAAVAAFALANGALLWRVRAELRRPAALALGMALALAAATIGAPKNSFWNQVPALLSAGLVLAAVTPDLRLSALDRTERLLLAAWLAGALVWEVLWVAPPPRDGPSAPFWGIAWSSSLYGMLALWVVPARRLWRMRS